MNEYKHRGWFWAGLGVSALIVAAIHLLIRQYIHLYIDMTSAIICAAVFAIQRKKNLKVWEEHYGKNDERDMAIEGRAALLTLKVSAVILFAIARLLLPEARGGLVVLGWLLSAGVFYYIATAYYENKM